LESVTSDAQEVVGDIIKCPLHVELYDRQASGGGTVGGGGEVEGTAAESGHVVGKWGGAVAGNNPRLP
jgi:hypothetical protein